MHWLCHFLGVCPKRGKAPSKNKEEGLANMLPSQIVRDMKEGQFKGDIGKKVILIAHEVRPFKEIWTKATNHTDPVACFTKDLERAVKDETEFFSQDSKRILSQKEPALRVKDTDPDFALYMAGAIMVKENKKDTVQFQNIPDIISVTQLTANFIARSSPGIGKTHPSLFLFPQDQDKQDKKYDYSLSSMLPPMRGSVPKMLADRVHLPIMFIDTWSDTFSFMRPQDFLIRDAVGKVGEGVLLGGSVVPTFFPPFDPQQGGPTLLDRLVQIPDTESWASWEWNARYVDTICSAPFFAKISAMKDMLIVPYLLKLLAVVDEYSQSKGGRGISADIVLQSVKKYDPEVIRNSEKGTTFAVEDEQGKRYTNETYFFSRRTLLGFADQCMSPQLWSPQWINHPLFKSPLTAQWSESDEGGYFQGSFFFFQRNAHQEPVAGEWLVEWSGRVYDTVIDGLIKKGWEISSEIIGDSVSMPVDELEYSLRYLFRRLCTPPRGRTDDHLSLDVRSFFGPVFTGVPLLVSQKNLWLSSYLILDGTIVTREVFLDMNRQCVERASQQDIKAFLYGVDSFLFGELMEKITYPSSKAKVKNFFHLYGKEKTLIRAIGNMTSRRPLDPDKLLELALQPKELTEISYQKEEESDLQDKDFGLVTPIKKRESVLADTLSRSPKKKDGHDTHESVMKDDFPPLFPRLEHSNEDTLMERERTGS
jgi:hypothetical protein